MAAPTHTIWDLALNQSRPTPALGLTDGVTPGRARVSPRAAYQDQLYGRSKVLYVGSSRPSGTVIEAVSALAALDWAQQNRGQGLSLLTDDPAPVLEELLAPLVPLQVIHGGAQQWLAEHLPW